MSLFPHSDRVIYSKAPLQQVICQFRYPAILRIESAPPVEFQDRIRGVLPVAERAAVGLAGQLPQEIAQAVAATFPTSQYIFRTEDGDAQIALTNDNMSLTVTRYTRWEDFRALLQPAIEALVDVYSPSYFSRIGLRYVNALRPSILNLEGHPWGSFLRPEVAGELVDPEWGRHVIDVRRAVRIPISQTPDQLLFQHGTGLINGNPEQIYMLDFDFYTDIKTEVGDAAAAVDRLNGYTGNAFRWAVSDLVHAALEPQPV